VGERRPKVGGLKAEVKLRKIGPRAAVPSVGEEMKGTDDAHLLEYEKLKDEQGRRIHFRDNMRYVTIAAIGVVAAQAGKSSPELWLVIPWICVILGWNYVANVHSVRAIGDYIKSALSEAVTTSAGQEGIFGWETARSEGDGRFVSRRVRQLLVDEITFFAPGVIALTIFGLKESGSVLRWLLAGVELLVCCWIAGQIYMCADASARTSLEERPRALARALFRRRRGSGGWPNASDRERPSALQPWASGV
jgi:hypothetical protein